MDRQCFACSRSIRPAEGPALLWGVPPSPQRREAFHLACWLAWRAERVEERDLGTDSLRQPIAA